MRLSSLGLLGPSHFLGRVPSVRVSGEEATAVCDMAKVIPQEELKGRMSKGVVLAKTARMEGPMGPWMDIPGRRSSICYVEPCGGTGGEWEGEAGRATSVTHQARGAPETTAVRPQY